MQELRAIAQRVKELPALDEYYAPKAREALHHVERSLFESVRERIDPGDAVACSRPEGSWPRPS